MLRPAALVALLASLLGAPGCGVKYVVSSAYYQAELLASRRPIDKVLASGGLSVGEEQRLRLLPEIKAYGATLGLGATDNYDTLAVGWRRAAPARADRIGGADGRCPAHARGRRRPRGGERVRGRVRLENGRRRGRANRLADWRKPPGR